MNKTGSMDFKKINFGKADAHTEGESYPDLLDKGYLDVSKVTDSALNDSVFLFLGYKGSGKSALSEHLRIHAESAIVDQQRLKDFPFKLFDKVHLLEDKNIRYKKIWEWLLCHRVFEDLYNDNDCTVRSRDDVKKVVTLFSQEGIFPSANLSSLIKKNTTQTISASVKGLNLSQSTSEENVDHDIELLIGYLKSIICTIKETSPHLIIIDDLDDILSPNGVQFGIITALINEVKDLNRFFKLQSIPVKIIVLCRTDMFDRLPDPNKNKIKQDNSFIFSWYREGINKPDDSDLIRLINIRARLVYPEIKDVFKTFFPKKYGDSSIYNALLDFTRHTPRDFVQLINHIQSQCGADTAHLSLEVIEKGIKDYSTEYFKQEIADEMSGYLPGPVVERVFSALSSIRNRDFDFDEFKEKFRYAPHRDDECGNDVEVNDIMRILYECSAIGHRYYYDNGRTTRYTFKYRNRSSSFNPDDRIFLHKGLWKALNVNF
ncbi:MAG: hypothetical protein IKR88_07365 [Bacteroidales bacterium]|nr:hypothetical protein [Bacteroidales bacterium]